MKIVALDLGKFNTMVCFYDLQQGQARFARVASTPAVLHDLLAGSGASRLVIEVGAMAGWVKDLGLALGMEVEVANVNAEAWRWSNVKRKTDRDDALKLAQMSALGKLPQVHVPALAVRQWRELIGYRQNLVRRRTGIKNRIRGLLASQGRGLPAGKGGWTDRAVAEVAKEALAMERCSAEELWRGMLGLELAQLEEVEKIIAVVEQKLEALAAGDSRVQLLLTIPGVGPRLAEVVVAVLDDARRFGNRKQVGCYAGLTPRQWQSGQMARQGRISGRGNKLLRALLVEVGWLMRRWNGHFAGVFSQVSRGVKTRKKIAVVAVARRLLVTCWAMLRDHQPWREREHQVAAA
jgi:transposase